MGSARASDLLRLRDGRRVVIRPIAPDDKQRLADGYARSTAEDQLRRFLSPVPELTPAHLRYLTEIDHRDHEALIAVDADTHESLGLARYIRDRDDPELAEVAVGVGSAFQQQGLATELLRRLAKRASEEGITRFGALITASNAPALRLIQGVFATSRMERDGTAVRLELNLAQMRK
jgi:RimJ/RimL family protein N-acetyltransferase